MSILFFIGLGIISGFLIPSIMRKVSNLLIELSFYLLIPLFIFINLSTSKVDTSNIIPTSIISWLIVGEGIILSIFFSKITKTPFRDIVLPITFMNSAYLNFPLQRFVLGEDALSTAIIYNLNITFLHFTLGIYLVKRKNENFYKAFIPLFAGILGLMWNLFKFQIPNILFKTGILLKNYFIPSMLILIGWQLSMLKVKQIHFGIIVTLLRMGGGFLLSFLILKNLKLENLIKNSILLTSSLPSAVNTFILTKKFNANPQYSSSSIFIGTLIAILLYPLIFPIF